MKIQIKTKTVLRLPSLFVLRFYLRRAYAEAGVPSPRRQAALLMRKIKEFRKANPEWYVVEITEKSGRTIRIKL